MLALAIDSVKPMRPAIQPVTSGEKKLITRPQLKMEAAVDRRCGG